MALKRTTPLSKVVAKPALSGAELKTAAKTAPSDDNGGTFTHQGSGSGKAGAADFQASSAILNSGKAATPTADTKSATVEVAGQNLRDHAVADRLKLGASGGEVASTTAEPKTPGQQTSDSGATTSPALGGGGTTGGGGGSSEGGHDPFASALTGRLDAATAGALSQLDAARPNLRGGLDVFQSAPGAATTSPGAGSSVAGLVGSGPNNPGSGSDPAADHAADVAGQLTGGRGSTASLFGDRLAGAQSDLAIAGGLLGDQTATASSPSAADGENPITARALDLAGKAADGDADAYRKLETLADEMHKDRAGAGEATGGVAYGARINADGELVAPSGGKAPGEDSPFWKSVADIFTGTKGLSGEDTVSGAALRQVLKDQDNLEDPGDPNNPEGGKPTPAQIAFRQALRDSLGAGWTGSGDIDPADNVGAPADAGAFAGASNNNLGLVGQPDETRAAGGTMRGPSTGTDIDPAEGSAFSGPALGGNPEDLSFGSTTLGIDAAKRSTIDDDDDDDDNDDDDE